MFFTFEMIMSSITILVLIIVIAAIFIKANQRIYARAVAPMALIPATYIVAGYVLGKLTDVLSTSLLETILIILIIISLVISFIVSGIISTKIKSLSRRIVLAVMLYGFFITYALICIFNLPSIG